jgi:hypothetical protein
MQMTRYIFTDGQTEPLDWDLDDDNDTLVDRPTPPTADQERLVLHWLQLNLTRIWTSLDAAYAELAVAVGAQPRDVAVWACDMFTEEAGLVYVALPLGGGRA